MIHDKVGHLGIFVSSSIAKKEHTEVTSTMKTIEALSPGLYEMTIDKQVGEGVDAQFQVSFPERKMSDLQAIDDNRDEERDFAAVVPPVGTGRRALRPDAASAGSGLGHRANPPNSCARPIRARVQRQMFSDQNPLMKPVAAGGEDQSQGAQEGRSGQSLPGAGKVLGGQRRTEHGLLSATCATPPMKRLFSASTARR